MALPFSFLCCSLVIDCFLQNNRKKFCISIRSFFWGWFSLAIIIFKAKFFVLMLFGQSGPDFAPHWDEEMALLYAYFIYFVRNFWQSQITFCFHPSHTSVKQSVKIKPPHWFRSYKDSFFLLQPQNILTYDKKSFCKGHVIHRVKCLKLNFTTSQFANNFLSSYLE